jgi:hypothetical protein
MDGGKMKELDFEKDIVISDDIHYEWGRQAELYVLYGLEFVNAQTRRDKARERLDYISAELDEKYRKQAETDGQKLTEKALATKIVNDARYRRANKEYIEAKAEEGKWGIVKSAFEHRKKALEYKAQFLINGIFSQPRTTKEKKIGWEALKNNNG